MQIEGVRMWAFWRRIQYGAGYLSVVMLLITAGYYLFLYQPPACFDGKMNGTELGVDCGGACVRICAFTVSEPRVEWAQSFPANVGQYNAVAYVANTNIEAATPALAYTFTLRDREGVITTRSGTTILPPNSTYPVFEPRIDTFGRTPTETTLTLEPVDLWLPYAYGRTQFRTSDLALTGADDRPRLAARIENTELVGAGEVEVVATIFDAQGNPLTASQTYIPTFPSRTEQAITFTWPQPIAKTLRSCDVPTDVLVAIDLSGSMNNDGDTPPEPISSVKTAAESFVRNLRTNDQVGLVTFASEAAVAAPLSTDSAAVAAKVRTLLIDPAEERGTTNTAAALDAALLEIASARHNADARSVVVLLTDGLATAPGTGTEPDAAALTAAAKLKAADVTLFTIGLGTSVNMDFLRTVASAPAQAYAAPTTATLQNIYSSITAAICEDGAARIDVIAKTPSNFPSY